jgi:AcrR family transcriptional regulator
VAQRTRNTEALRARRRIENRSRLLDAVERLYEDNLHYSEISVERLIREAGITRSTFYAYFDDKDSLLQELAATVLDELLSYWTELPAGATRAELQQGITQIVESYIPHRAVMVAVGDPAPGSDARERFETLFIERSATEVAAFISAGQKAGTVDSNLHPQTTAALLMWMTERGLAKLVAPASRANAAALAESLADIFWRVLSVETA